MVGRTAPHGKSSGIKRRAAEATERLEGRRSTSTVVDTVFRAIQLDREAGCALLAGAIAFRFFLFLVPCVFVIMMAFGIGADLASANPRDVARSAGIAGIAATAIQSSSEATAVTRWLTFAIAAVAVIVGSRNLVRVIAVSHARIWQVPYRPIRHSALAGFAVVGFSAVTVVLIRMVAALRDHSFVGWIVGLVAFALVPAGIWLLGSAKLFPTGTGVTWRQLMPGALLFGLGVEGLHVVTVLWVTRSIESKSETYGAIGAALTLLVWAYLLGRLVTSAAILNVVTATARYDVAGRVA